jgi:hypothetical protein
MTLSIKDVTESIQSIINQQHGQVTVKIHDGRIAEIDEMKVKRDK